MPLPCVRGIRSVEIEVGNLAEAVRFYVDVWRLKLVDVPPHPGAASDDIRSGDTAGGF
jgi:catechol 2,3-dioxygenase-like lactoylglutathione lyase family enzyme